MKDLFPETVPPLVKKWLPEAYQDESIPPPLKSPDDWIITINGFSYLRSAGNRDDPDMPLSEGQIVEFYWMADLATGTVTMKISDDDDEELKPELSILHPTPQEGTFLTMWEPDGDTISENLEDFTMDMAEGEEREIQFYVWSNPIPFTFRHGKFHAAAEAA